LLIPSLLITSLLITSLLILGLPDLQAWPQDDCAPLSMGSGTAALNRAA
tara:strand:+ start:8031 stop:8177 length:147 start_codon:yes stop_codon:yes gene_type:complete